MLNFGFQGSVTPIMEGIIDLHNHIFFFLILIFVFVFWLFSSILYRFWWKARFPINRVSLVQLRHLSHNTRLEMVWTVFPSFILVAIAVPSFALLYAMDEVLEPTLTLKAVGHQWYWSYQYSNCLPTALNLSKDIRFIPQSLWESILTEAKFLGMSVFARTGYKLSDVSIEGSPFTFAEVGISKERLLPFLAKEIRQFREILKIPESNSTGDGHETIFRPWVISRLRTRLIYYLANSPCDLTGGVSKVPTVEFDSYMLSEADLQPGDYRLLDVDEPVVLPSDTHIRLLVTGEDVIHSFALPQMGVKIDAIPGRLNQQGIFIKRIGTFYGQCSEICGVNHGFMPIVIHSVPFDDFIFWYTCKLHVQEPSMDLELVDPYDVINKLTFNKPKVDPIVDFPQTDIAEKLALNFPLKRELITPRSSLMVECRLVKPRDAGSIPVFREIQHGRRG